MKKSEVLPAAAPADVRAAIQDAYDWLTTLGFPEILPVMRNLRGLLDAPQPAPADERAAFEAYMTRKGYVCKTHMGAYVSGDVASKWDVWQARAAASPAAEAVVIYQATEGYGIWSDVSREMFEDSSPGRRRIVYSAPQPAQADAPAHAAECPPYTDYQLRVIYERAQLDERLKSLVLFVASEKFGELSEVDRSLLRRQSYLMFSLLCVLDRRIERFG